METDRNRNEMLEEQNIQMLRLIWLLRNSKTNNECTESQNVNHNFQSTYPFDCKGLVLCLHEEYI